MATTGEKLVELSSLLTGTALEHLLSITVGGGGIAFDVELEDIDTVVVEDIIEADVELDDADFDVKIIEKTTIITKE